MLDPLFLSEKDIERLESKYNLSEISNVSDDIYFLKRQLLKYSLNTDDFKEIITNSNMYQIVTGFGLTGGFHLGNKLILEEVKYFQSKKIEANIFLSISDAESKSINIDQYNRNKKDILTQLNALPKMLTHLHINNNYNKHPLFTQLEDLLSQSKIFEDVYQENLSMSVRNALTDMATSILDNNAKFPVVILGIDEIYNAVFISECSKLINKKAPIFLFNKILVGYDGNKMGKSRQDFSLITTNKPEDEISKVSKYLCKEDVCNDSCPARNILNFSKYYIERNSDSVNYHSELEKIIKLECSAEES
jgi:tryptophanyl-tRNA synthetase